MGKIKAFTILELMVTMVLISVAIAVAMVVLQMVQTQFSRFEQSGHRHSELFLLNTMLKRDFMRSAEIYRGQNTLLFLGFEDTVTYSINPETITVYKKNTVDTLQVATSYWETFFQENTLEDGLIDQLVLQAAFQSDTVMIKKFKEYAPDMFVNQIQEDDATNRD